MLRATRLTRQLAIPIFKPTHTYRSMSAPTAAKFEASPIPNFDGANYTKTSAMLVIGDEILSGKTSDSNSHFLAKLLFSLGVELKRIEVVADVEEEIAEAVQRMSKAYDLVVTSGGIG